MKTAFIGTGYVGLVTGSCFAEVGHDVVCVDVDEAKIQRLLRGELPIFEPGLEQIVAENIERGRLSFTTDLKSALDASEIVFVAVGTPQRPDGSANLDFVWTVIDQIRELATEPKVVVIKSTVPVGTNRLAAERLNQGEIQHVVASNPEFLREGLAVGDALGPDRIVIGFHDDAAREKLVELYQPYTDNEVPLLCMEWESAEMTKYVANCVLATKISYINEMANMCESVGADINDVRQGIGHDPRIGFQFFAPGVGYGGSCFPKDVRAMHALAREHGMPMQILEAVDAVNERQKERIFEKLQEEFSSMAGVQVAVWGLAFKPETDDIREAPAIVLIQQLLDAGAQVTVFDPEAMDNVRRMFQDQVAYAQDMYEAAADADVLAIVTEWDEFKRADLQQLHAAMAAPRIVDGRNLFDLTTMKNAGFAYRSVGRRALVAARAAATT